MSLDPVPPPGFTAGKCVAWRCPVGGRWGLRGKIPSHSKSGFRWPRSQARTGADCVWRKAVLITTWWECQLVQPLWKSAWKFLQNLGLTCEPVVSRLQIARRTTETLGPPQTIWMSIHRWMDKDSVLQTHSAVRKNEIMKCADNWSELRKYTEYILIYWVLVT